MKIGLFFGSFNPIHTGHLVIANYLLNHTDLKQVWFVVSPHNPHKNKQSLLADHHRLALVQEAIERNDRMRVSNIEFGMPQPNYTVKTLAVLHEKHPEHQFALIVGEDNLRTFHKWYNYEQILANHELYVYPRAVTMQAASTAPDESDTLYVHPHVHLQSDAPIMAISASYIRQAIHAGKDVRYLLTPEVLKYIEEMGFYR